MRFYLNLRTGKEEMIKEFSLKVSDPKSPMYKKYVTREQLREMAAAPPEVEKAVWDWLKEASGDAAVALHSYGDVIRVTTTVRNAEELLATRMHVFRHEDTGYELVRAIDGANLPVEIAGHVTYVVGVSELMLPVKFEAEGTARLHDTTLRKRAAGEPDIIPSVLKSEYNVPTTLEATQTSNRQAIAAFYDYYSDDALRVFESTFGLPAADVTALGEPDCTPACEQIESNLDVQYVTAMGTGVPTLFREYNSNEFTYELALDLVDPSIPDEEVAYVYSISYGAPESLNVAYIGASETQLAKLPALGITVFAASGDDGALGAAKYAANCPLDTTQYCFYGGCAHSSTQCGQFIVSQGSNTCIYPSGWDNTASRRSSGCSALMPTAFNQDADEWAATASGSCTLAIETDVFNYPWFYSSCACSALQNNFTSSNGYRWQRYTYQPQNGRPLNAFYPASSAWVTSVGATQFVGTSSPYTELPAQVTNSPPSVITTGGGFSELQARPSWQSSFVDDYLNSGVALPPDGVYNASARAYPDITFNGHRYVIVANRVNGDSACNPYCNYTIVDGTSASSPALAGLFALVNDALIEKGDPPVGFLNPILYQMASESPSAYRDITTGDIRSNSRFACYWGFEATTGWDPVTGLGSIDYVNVHNYIVGNELSNNSNSNNNSGGTTSDSCPLPNMLRDALCMLMH